MGWLDKAAAFSFGLALVGLTIGSIALQAFDSPSLAGWLLLVWFAPTLLWVACFWAYSSRVEFGGVCAFWGIVSFAGALGGTPLVEVIIGFAAACFLSFLASSLAKPAGAILNIGRPNHTQLRLDQ